MFGAIGDGKSDDSNALYAMARQARARGYLTCAMTAGKIYTHRNPFFLSGIERIWIEGNGARIMNLRGGKVDKTFLVNYSVLAFADCFSTNGHNLYHGRSTPHHFGALIGSAKAGSSSVVVYSGRTTLAPGARVLIYGFDRISIGGYPPSPRFFEYNAVEDIRGNVVRLKNGLRYDYDADWLDGTIPNGLGRPRILSLDRPDFRQSRSIVIRNLGSALNERWTAPGSSRNGRLTFCGFDNLLLDGVVTDGGGIYVSQGGAAEINRTRANLVETDKVLDRVTYRNCVFGSHAQGIGCKELILDNVEVTGEFSASAIERLAILGGNFKGHGSGASTILMGNNNHAIGKLEIHGARFSVKPPRYALLPYRLRSIRISSVVDSQTLGIGSQTMYEASFFSRVASPGMILYTKDGAAALRLTRMPYRLGKNVCIQGKFLSPIEAGDVLYAPELPDVTVDGAIYTGENACRVTTFGLGDTTVPFPTQLTDPLHPYPGRLQFSSRQVPSNGMKSFFEVGFRLRPRRIVVDVVKPYTGALPAQLSLKSLGSPAEILRIDLRVAGTREITPVRHAGLIPSDVFTTMDDVVQRLQVQVMPALGDQTDMPLWTASLDGVAA